MLLRVAISNFLSFYDRTTFDMFPNPKRVGFKNHIYDMAVPLLKMGVLYGANNAGKSNFVKAIQFLRNFVVKDNYITPHTFESFRFKLSDNQQIPICISVEFYFKEQYYIYFLELDKKIHEVLLVSGLGSKNDELVFERDDNKLKSDYVFSGEIVKDLLRKNPYSSILALNNKFPVLKSRDVDNAYNWFKDNLLVIGINSDVDDLIKMMEANQSLLDFSNKMMQSLGISDSLSIRKMEFDEWLNTSRAQTFHGLPELSQNDAELVAKRNRRNEFHLTVKDGKRMVSEFMFKQHGPTGKTVDMDIDTQSDGTVRLLTLLPAFFAAMKEEKVVLIDEIENSMHPNMIYQLVKYYAQNSSNGQLVFTTHLTRFQNQQELLRVDELWMVNKLHGMTYLKSFNDFKIHNTINVENGYVEGRFGGVPLITL